MTASQAPQIASKAGEKESAIRGRAHQREPEPPMLGPLVEGALLLQELAGNQATIHGLTSSAAIGLGSPLDVATRMEMESRFGQSFADVQVHTDGKAAASAESAHAEAFTVGSHVVFGPGRFDPGSLGGRRLLSHELAHVVQQRRGGAPASPAAGGALEAAADVAAGAMESGSGPVAVAGAASPGMSRQPKPGEGPSLLDPDASLKLDLNLGTLSAFDHNRDALTPEHKERIPFIAQTIIALLVRMPYADVKVVGHTDLTGGEDYNLDLGRKRALTVAAALAEAGVPMANLKIESKGESSPAVDTEKREPMNRRVEINFAGDASAIGPLFKNQQQGEPGGGGTTTPDTGGGGTGVPGGGGPGPKPGGVYKPPTIPPVKQKTLKEMLKERVKADPIAKKLGELLDGNKLTKKAYDAAIDGLTDAIYTADEKIAEKVIDLIPLDDSYKGALKALAKALLKTAKGEKWVPPQPPPYELPPGPKYEPAPGEKIFKFPPIRF